MVQVYKYELDDGLTDIIQANASIAFCTEVVPSNTDEKDEFYRLLFAAAQANPGQLDLFYLKSILVSVGWNKNDDVFDPYEVWKARSTPVDKPFNFMHNEKDIIGHLTSSVAVDFDGNIIADDTPFDDLPSQFDLIVGSVLYKRWTDADAQTRIDNIIAEIAEGKWKVSMECLFPNFDYAVITPSGDQRMVRRTEASSFLTKHLRIYGGSGVYDGYKVGRLLRDFTFSGKGLVDKPANPRSSIINFSSKEENEVFVSSAELSVHDLGEKYIMTAIVTYTQEQYEFLKRELDEIKANMTERDSKISALEQQVATLQAEKDQLSSDVAASQESLAQKDTIITELTTKVEAAESARAEAEEKIAVIEKEKIYAQRLSQLLEKDVTEDRAKSLVEKFASASDEMFCDLVEALPQRAAASTDEEEEEEEEEGTTEAQALENGETESSEGNLNLSQASVDQTVEAAKATSSWFGSILRTTATKK